LFWPALRDFVRADPGLWHHEAGLSPLPRCLAESMAPDACTGALAKLEVLYTRQRNWLTHVIALLSVDELQVQSCVSPVFDRVIIDDTNRPGGHRLRFHINGMDNSRRSYLSAPD